MADHSGNVDFEETKYYESERSSKIGVALSWVPWLDGMDETSDFLKGIVSEPHESELTVGLFSFVGPLAAIAAVSSGREVVALQKEINELAKEENELREELEASGMLLEDNKRHGAARFFSKLGLLFREHYKRIAKMNGFEYDPEWSVDYAKEDSVVKIMASFAKYQDIEKELFVAKCEQQMAITETTALTALTASSVPAIMHGVESFKDLEAATEVAEATAETLEIAAGSFILAGQVAMLAYSGYRAKQGLDRMRQIDKGIGVVESGCVDYRPDTLEHVHQVFSKQRKFIKNHSAVYGALTGSGQVFSISGTACALSGVGILAAAPLLGTGMVLTVSGAAVKRINTGAENKFIGAKGFSKAVIKKYQEERNPFDRLNRNANKDRVALIESCAKSGARVSAEDLKARELKAYQDTANQAQDDLCYAVEAMAAQEVLRLARKMCTARKYKKLDPRDKLNELERDLLSFDVLNGVIRDAKVKGVDLEGIACKAIRDFYVRNRVFIRKEIFEEENKGRLNKKLVDCTVGVVACLDKRNAEHGASEQGLSLAGALNKVRSSGYGSVDRSEVLQSIGVKNSDAKVSNKFAKKVVRKGRWVCRAARYHATANVVGVAEAKECYIEARAENNFAYEEEIRSAARVNGEIEKKAALIGVSGGAFVHPGTAPGVPLFGEPLSAAQVQDQGLGVVADVDEFGYNDYYVFTITGFELGSVAKDAGLCVKDQIFVSKNRSLEEVCESLRGGDLDGIVVTRDGDELPGADSHLKKWLDYRRQGSGVDFGGRNGGAAISVC